LVIELFGQPGAGKSMLARAFSASSETTTKAHLSAAWTNLPTLSKASITGRAILDGACLIHAARLAVIARLFRRDSLSRLLRLVIKSHRTREQRGRLVLEEGHLQDLWSICYSAGRTDPDPRQFAPLIRCLYRQVDARIIFLDIDPQSAFARIRGRVGGKSRLDRLGDADLRRHLAATAQLSHKLADAARLAGLKVELLDASQPIETNAGRLSSLMRELDSPRAS
jgi:thymidylate kinase